jgi:hypothetical protein
MLGVRKEISNFRFEISDACDEKLPGLVIRQCFLPLATFSSSDAGRDAGATYAGTS